MFSQLSRSERIQARYRADPSFRRTHIDRVRRSQGAVVERRHRKLSYSVQDVCDLLGIHRKTFHRWRRLGLVPDQTYPSIEIRYWPHQVLLICRVFRRMRDQGWPKSMPKVIGSADWNRFMKTIQAKWDKEVRYA